MLPSVHTLEFLLHALRLIVDLSPDVAVLSGPLQLHHGTSDTSVPVEYSEDLYARLQEEGVASELYIYQGDDHNLLANFSAAMRRSVEFFDLYVKGE